MSDTQGAGSVPGQPQVLDMAKYGKLLIPVQGFENPVPLEQVAQGFMRNSDYTNKTQQLADDRRELESKKEQISKMEQWFDALDRDPAGTFRQMQRAWNIDPDSVSVDGDPEGDPQVASLQAELSALKQQLEQSSQSTQELAAVSQLREQFPDLSPDDVKAYMGANNMESHRILDAAKLMSYDRIAEEQRMAAEHNAARQAQLDAVVGQKQGLPPVSPGGAPTPSPDLLPNTEPALPSWEESFELAQAELGQGLP